MDSGNLQEYIQTKKWPLEDLLEMSRQIAAGMDYLASQQIVHR